MPPAVRWLWLLDTNVLSEPVRPRPDAVLMARLKLHEDAVAVPSPVWHELRYGWLRMTSGARKDRVGHYLRDVVAPLPLLAYDGAAASLHAGQRAAAEQAGRGRPFADGQIAAIAVAHGLTLVTRNLKDFEGVPDLRIVDWFAP